MERASSSPEDVEFGVVQCNGEAEKSPTHSKASTYQSRSTLLPVTEHPTKSGRRRRCCRFPPRWTGSSRLGASRRQAPKQVPQERVRKLEECPRGYPNLAAFVDSDESFMVYRRFGWLQSRLLLDKQDELRCLERTLDAMDQDDAGENPTRLVTRDLSKEEAAPRRDLLKQIEDKYREYASLLVLAQQIVSFNKPAPCDYRSVVNYMGENKPLVAEEAKWIQHREDIITLRSGREHAWLDSGIEHVLKWIQTRLGAKRIVEYFFCPPEELRKSTGRTVYFDREVINNVASSVIIFAILVLLVVPIYVLYHLIADIGNSRSYATSIGVLLVFTLAFSAVLSLFTRARRHEILAAAAAYCAVLVVFLGNVGNSSH